MRGVMGKQEVWESPRATPLLVSRPALCTVTSLDLIDAVGGRQRMPCGPRWHALSEQLLPE